MFRTGQKFIFRGLPGPDHGHKDIIKFFVVRNIQVDGQLVCDLIHPETFEIFKTFFVKISDANEMIDKHHWEKVRYFPWENLPKSRNNEL